jgi:hypothetical protein
MEERLDAGVLGGTEIPEVGHHRRPLLASTDSRSAPAAECSDSTQGEKVKQLARAHPATLSR